MLSLTDIVRDHATAVLERARAPQGNSALLADGFQLASGAPLQWQECLLSNLARQQNFLRTLEGLTSVTGESRWLTSASDWISPALEQLRHPASDLLYWGGHSAWDLGAAAPMQGNHELKCAFPHYAGLHTANPDATSAFIDAFWHAHIWDWSSLLFNRHGEYEPWDRSRRWQEGTFAESWPLPIIENSALSFINTGSDLIWAACHKHRLTGEQAPLHWAKALLSRYDAIRHADTGLGGYQFNHREPCRVRASFRDALGQRPDVNETTVIGRGYIEVRYGRVAAVFLDLAEHLDPVAAAPFRDFVRRDLLALQEHAWDEAAGLFHPVLNDGTRLSPADVDDTGYCPPSKLAPLRANGLMLLAYARAGRVLADPALQHMALQLAQAMGWGQLLVDGGDARAAASALTGKPDDTAALAGLLELHRTFPDADLLPFAETLARAITDLHGLEGLLCSSGDGGDAFPAVESAEAGSAQPRITGIDSGLPIALLHLAHLQTGDGSPPTAYVPSLSYFDPKILARQRGLRS